MQTDHGGHGHLKIKFKKNMSNKTIRKTNNWHIEKFGLFVKLAFSKSADPWGGGFGKLRIFNDQIMNFKNKPQTQKGGAMR